MADDLSNLSELEPGATDPSSSGDDEIRKTRLHVKNWAGVEHDLTGPHKFLSGNDAARPAAGIAGRIYINTEHSHVQRDTGAAWTTAHAVGIHVGDQVGTLTIPSAAEQTIVSKGIVVPAANGVLVLAQCSLQIAQNADPYTQFSFVLKADGVAIDNALVERVATVTAATGIYRIIHVMATESPVTDASRTYTFHVTQAIGTYNIHVIVNGRIRTLVF